MASLLQFYLNRPARKMQTPSGYVSIPESKVPMIPIDILPEWIEIIGLPRSLRDNHAVGLTSLGHVEQPEGSLEVRLRKVDPSVHNRPMSYIDISQALSGGGGASTASTTRSLARESPRRGTMPGDYVRVATLEELRNRPGKKADGERMGSTAEPRRPNVDALREVMAENPMAKGLKTAKARGSGRAVPPDHQQPLGPASRTKTSAMEEVPVASKIAAMAKPNGLSSSVHARHDVSIETATRAGSMSAAPPSRHQRLVGRAPQLLGSDNARRGARKNAQFHRGRRYYHH